MAITYPAGRHAIEGKDAAFKVSELTARDKDRDFGAPAQLIDCGGLPVFGDRFAIPISTGRARFSFDFATDGPADVGDFVLGVLPKGAIVRGGYIDVITGIVGGTIALNVNGAGDLLVAATPGAGLVDLVPAIDTVGSFIKTTADTNLVMTVAGSNLTAGKFHVFLEVDLSE